MWLIRVVLTISIIFILGLCIGGKWFSRKTVSSHVVVVPALEMERPFIWELPKPVYRDI